VVSTKQILLVSPREPSGATWLINCFLELGIRTFRRSRPDMWQYKDGAWTVTSHQQILKKWLPILSRQDSFTFRDDIEVRWTHEWPSSTTRQQEIVLFVRDPRDALYSRFRREATDLTFKEFLSFLDPWSLLDKVDNWILFVRSWAMCGRVHVVRFEDYKADAVATLGKTLNALGIVVSDADLHRAVEESTFEKAAAAEAQYRQEHPEDEQVINRKGMPREWSAVPELKVEMEQVSRRCAYLLEEFGYVALGDKSQEPDFARHAQLVRSLAEVSRQLSLRNGMQGAERPESGLIGRVCEFAVSVTPHLMDRAGLNPNERKQLVQEVDRYLTQICEIARRKRNEIQPWSQMVTTQVKETVAQFLSFKGSRLR
jgi:hypothetical protein